jgi:hypothetical protein
METTGNNKSASFLSGTETAGEVQHQAQAWIREFVTNQPGQGFTEVVRGVSTDHPAAMADDVRAALWTLVSLGELELTLDRKLQPRQHDEGDESK